MYIVEIQIDVCSIEDLYVGYHFFIKVSFSNPRKIIILGDYLSFFMVIDDSQNHLFIITIEYFLYIFRLFASLGEAEA